MIKQYKLDIVKYLQNTLKTTQFLMVLNIHKTRAEEMRYLKKKLIKENIFLKIIKNKLIKHAIYNTKFAMLNQDLSGQIALVWCSNINLSIVAIKIIHNIKNDKNILYPISGFIGSKKVNNKYIESLSSIPNINTLRFKLLFILRNYLEKIIKSINYSMLMIINILKNKK